MAPNASNTPDPRPHEQNRRAWNAVTPAHNSHKLDQASFFRDGGSTLFPEEIELLGDIDGQRLAHLQCNCGQDSLSLSQRGAEVTGIDISDAAISFAQTLSEQTSIAARFHRSDLYEWFETTTETFDIAYVSYGAITWLLDIDSWARGVQRILVPGGRLVLLDFHPLSWSYSFEDQHSQLKEPYFVEDPIHEQLGVGDYIGEALSPSGFAKGIEDYKNPETATCYQHTTADIVNAVSKAGLRIDRLIEYPYANGCEIFAGMERLSGNRYGMPSGTPAMPLMLGLCAQRV